MAMEWEPVDSSMCTHVGYDDETQEMGVRYQNGRKSIYGSEGYPVPRDVYEAVKIGSVGKNLHTMVQGDQYPHRYG